MLKEALTDQNMVQIRKVAVIGAGNIGGAIAAGMAAGGSVSPADIIVTAREALAGRPAGGRNKRSYRLSAHRDCICDCWIEFQRSL